MTKGIEGSIIKEEKMLFKVMCVFRVKKDRFYSLGGRRKEWERKL